MIFTNVDPEPLSVKAANGRGAWTRKGIDFEYRYMVSPDLSQRIGTRAEISLDHWAVSAGSFAIQNRLSNLGIMDPVAVIEKGIFGPRTKAAVKMFQGANKDPLDDRALVVDGIVGRSDARALFLPVARKAEKAYAIPEGLLVGQTNHESMFDPGAVGFYIYYPSYRGVDRGLSQINSKFNPQVTWEQAYDPSFAFGWSAKRLRDYFDRYQDSYPQRSLAILWDAALCAHNNPWAAGEWAAIGFAPSELAAKYVAAVKAAVF